MLGESVKSKNNNMKNYIGTKFIKAKPMSLGLYNQMRGWEIPSDEDPNREGYMVRYKDGYISWSPKEVFEESYRETNGLTFGMAIELLKQGHKVARKGWNGKNMFLFLLPAGTVPTKAIHDPALREVIEREVGGDTFEALGSIRMFTADKKILTGWLASQTDILSEDWEIVQ